jgi:hypothetical protein
MESSEKWAELLRPLLLVDDRHSLQRTAIAAQFMAALLANPEYTTEDFHAIARDAITAADTLLKELNND